MNDSKVELKRSSDVSNPMVADDIFPLKKTSFIFVQKNVGCGIAIYLIIVYIKF